MSQTFDNQSQYNINSQTSTSSQTRRLRKHGSGTGAWNTPVCHPVRAWNTPVSITETSTQTFGFDGKKAGDRYARLAREMEGLVVGPMPVEDFLDYFLAASSIDDWDDMPSPSKAFDRVMAESDDTEVDIYADLIIALNGNGQESSTRCPGFCFRDTSNNVDNSGGRVGSTKPDISCFATRHLSSAEAARKDTQSRSDMGFAVTFIEVKGKRSLDFFSDPPAEGKQDVDRETWRFVYGTRKPGEDLTYIIEAFGQNIAYAVEICARQHRTCCFSVALFGTWARLIRWDRAGAVVTRGFDIRTDPELLCKFFWCFSQATDAGRGYDLTVEPAAQEDEERFRLQVSKHIMTQVQLSGKDQLEKWVDEHYARSHVTAVYFPSPIVQSSDPQASTVDDCVLVSRPLTVPLSVAGRSTRVYWAVDATSGSIYFLKDTWTRHHEREGEILQALCAHGVRNVPKPIYHGDVLVTDADPMDAADVVATDFDTPQTTLTQEFIDEPWVCGNKAVLSSRIVKRTHYRLLLNVVGYPLLKFRGSSELFHGVYNAFQGLTDAYRLCHRCHRDVTPNNIILYNEPLETTDGQRWAEPSEAPRTGYLVDWGLSWDISGKDTHPDYEPSLTWQFLSIKQCSRTGAPHTIQDDMESLLYVVVYCALLHLKHGLSPGDLRKTLNVLFDQRHTLDRGDEGGGGKMENLTRRAWTRRANWTSKDVAVWFDTMYDYLATHVIAKLPTPLCKWTVEEIDRHWSAFLALNTLPANDRVDNLVGYSYVFESTAPRNALSLPIQPTLTSGHKRPEPDTQSSDLQRKSKVPRVESAPSDWHVFQDKPIANSDEAVRHFTHIPRISDMPYREHDKSTSTSSMGPPPDVRAASFHSYQSRAHSTAGSSSAPGPPLSVVSGASLAGDSLVPGPLPPSAYVLGGRHEYVTSGVLLESYSKTAHPGASSLLPADVHEGSSTSAHQDLDEPSEVTGHQNAESAQSQKPKRAKSAKKPTIDGSSLTPSCCRN
ncbi:hypothetical protein BV20DRAFT_618342 [Pilatotrama ljubarskyi]|nr:hypothetical protein BV20DRAFT_618342 [Pilatotrama ljubarskyi]